MRQWNAIKTLVDATKTFPMRWLTLETRRLSRGRSEISANFNVLHFLRNLLNVGRSLAKTSWCDGTLRLIIIKDYRVTGLYIFVAESIGLSSFNFHGDLRKTHVFWNRVAIQGHPRWFILAPIESTYSVVTLVKSLGPSTYYITVWGEGTSGICYMRYMREREVFVVLLYNAVKFICICII